MKASLPLLLLSLPLSAAAVSLSPDAALQRALLHAPAKICGNGPRWSLNDIVETPRSGETALYIFSRENASGFIITSADDALPAILAYSDQGDAGFADFPDNARAWIEQWTQEIELLYGAKGEHSVVVRESAEDSRMEISPMVLSKWAQDAPYNLLTPTFGNRHTNTGCLATALAQVLNYHRLPASNGFGSHSYTINGREVSFDFSETTFDWLSMRNSYKRLPDDIDTIPTQQQLAVATLMKACGVSLDTNYQQYVSTAYSMRTPLALTSFFGYNSNCCYLKSEYFSDMAWDNLLYTELACGRPVVYNGSSSSEAHAFVCDGYAAGGFYHFNWGWRGIADGYYRLSLLEPSDNGEPMGNVYKFSQSIVAGIAGNNGYGMFPHLPLMATGDFSCTKLDAKPNYAIMSFNIGSSGVVNYSASDVSAIPGVMLVGNDTIIYLRANAAVEIKGVSTTGFTSSYREFTTRALPSHLPAGSYIARPAVVCNDVWSDLRIADGKQQFAWLRVATDHSMTMENTENTSLSQLWCSSLSSADGKLKMLVEAGDSDYDGDIILCQCLDDGTCSFIARQNLSLPANSNETLEIEVPESFANGAHTFIVKDFMGCDISLPTSINLEISQAPEYIILSQRNAIVATGESARIEARVMPEGASNSLVTWSSSNPEVAAVTDGVVECLVPGETVITASASNGVASSCRIISKPLPQSISIEPGDVEVPLHYSLQLKAVITPEEAADDELTWHSSDDETLSVDEYGVVTAHALGEAEITVETSNSLTASCKARSIIVKVESITLNPSEIEAVEGTTVHIEAIIEPSTATDKSLMWISNHTSIARCDDDGNVTITGPGEAEITAKALDGSGVSATCHVNGISGIDEIFNDSETFDIYDINGSLVKENATRNDILTLHPGVYIFKSGSSALKVVVAKEF